MIVHGEGERYEVRELSGYSIGRAGGATPGNAPVTTDVFVVDHDYCCRVVYAENTRSGRGNFYPQRRERCETVAAAWNREHEDWLRGRVA